MVGAWRWICKASCILRSKVLYSPQRILVWLKGLSKACANTCLSSVACRLYAPCTWLLGSGLFHRRIVRFTFPTIRSRLFHAFWIFRSAPWGSPTVCVGYWKVCGMIIFHGTWNTRCYLSDKSCMQGTQAEGGRTPDGGVGVSCVCVCLGWWGPMVYGVHQQCCTSSSLSDGFETRRSSLLNRVLTTDLLCSRFIYLLFVIMYLYLIGQLYCGILPLLVSLIKYYGR